MAPVEQRKTGLSVAITAGILVVLGVMATAHRRSGGRPDALAGDPPREEASAESPVAGRGAAGTDPYVNPLDPPPKAEWEVLPNCRWLPNKTNAAHHFHVKRGDDPYVFQLYCVEAPEVAGHTDDQIGEQSRYFGLSETLSGERCGEVLGEIGERARQAVEALIAERKLLILTRWERRADTHHFYALVFFEADDGTRRSLQEWLVENGYGVITRRALGRLPTGQTSEEFLAGLEARERVAQQHRRGAWTTLTARP